MEPGQPKTRPTAETKNFSPLRMAGRVPASGDWTELCRQLCKRLHPTLHLTPHARSHLLKLLIFRCSITKAAPPPGKSMTLMGRGARTVPVLRRACRLATSPSNICRACVQNSAMSSDPSRGPCSRAVARGSGQKPRRGITGTQDHQLLRAGWERGTRPAESKCMWPLRTERGCKGEAELGLWVGRMLMPPRGTLALRGEEVLGCWGYCGYCGMPGSASGVPRGSGSWGPGSPSGLPTLLTASSNHSKRRSSIGWPGVAQGGPPQ